MMLLFVVMFLLQSLVAGLAPSDILAAVPVKDPSRADGQAALLKDEALDGDARFQPFEETPAPAPTPFEITGEVGIILSIFGGISYSITALLTPLAATRLREGVPGWTDQTLVRFQLLSVGFLGFGGGILTLAYGSGYPLALLNAIAYSIQLILNMIFQMYFSLSEYNKSMMVGTIVFATTTAMIAEISPAPAKVEVGALLEPAALAFQFIWWLLWIIVLCGLQRVRSRGLRDPCKIASWAWLVTGLGVLTDNWGRVMGVTEAPMYYVLVGTIFIPASAIAYMNVKAMAELDVAIFLPMQLCFQITGNVVGGYFLWGDGGGMDHATTYLLGYVVILLSVYISTPELDAMATLLMRQERRNAGLSQGDAKTSFGKRVLSLVTAWNELRYPSQKQNDDASQDWKEALKEALVVGFQSGMLEPEKLADLSVHIWMEATNTTAGAEKIMQWLEQTPYFQDYCMRDPEFRTKLLGTVPPAVRRRSTLGLSNDDLAGGSKVELS